jgi:hypothetical protein
MPARRIYHRYEPKDDVVVILAKIAQDYLVMTIQ